MQLKIHKLHKRDGNYIYIPGSVTNVSFGKMISYFEVEAKFCDSKGKVIDSDWTKLKA